MTRRHEDSTAVEGGTPVCLRFLVEGRLTFGSYSAFVLDRAAWLDISGWVSARPGGSIEIVAAGPEALVGAFEMACTLGPLDALVDRIETTPVPAFPKRRFELR